MTARRHERRRPGRPIRRRRAPTLRTACAGRRQNERVTSSYPYRRPSSNPFARAIIARVVITRPAEAALGSRLDHTRAPYFQVLLDYVDAGVIPFHTPGHKQGIGMDRAFRDFVGDNVLAIDLTQIRGLDDLLQPEGPLVEAQALAADAFGADHTYFLINGSTSGNQCMMMAAVNPGEKIAIPRNSHKSAMGGLIMSGGYPVWMKPEVDEELHMDHTVTPQTVRETLQAHPDIKAVYVVSPTYYG